MAAKRDGILAALAAGDSAALAAAGVSPEVIRHLAAARAFARVVSLYREQPKSPPSGEYWRKSRSTSANAPAQKAEAKVAERELELALRDAFGSDWGSALNSNAGDGPYGFLPTATQERIRRIERDYEEMENEISARNGGVELAADREKLKLLAAEKDRDLAAEITPAQREQMKIRTSQAGHFILQNFGDIVASEDEFMKLYALRKEFEERFSSREYQSRPRTTEDFRLRAEAEGRFADVLRAGTTRSTPP